MGFETNFTSFEIARPVISGADTLVKVVRLAGRSIMDDLDEAVVIPGEYTIAHDNDMPQNVAGTPRFRAYSKIRLPIVQYIAETRTGVSTPDFHRLASLLSSSRRYVRPTARQRAIGDISNTLRHIALKYDSVNAEEALAQTSSFKIQPARTKSGYELLLAVESPERFLEEAKVYNDIFGSIKTIKPYVKEHEKTYIPAIPLAWVASDTTPEEHRRLLDRLNQNIVGQHIVHLGAMLKAYVDRVRY